MKRKYLVEGCFDHANKKQQMMVTIDSKSDLVTMRVFRRHEAYETTLTALIEMAYRRAAEQKAKEDNPRKRRTLAKRGLLSLK